MEDPDKEMMLTVPQSDEDETARHVRPLTQRSRGKRADILHVAREQFLKYGFDGTSIDSIVEIVGGSKSTIYGYFGSKESLFAAVIRVAGHEPEAEDFPVSNGNVRDELIAFAQDRMRHVLSPLNIAMMRIVIAEADRFPQIAELFYNNAPQPTYDALRKYLVRSAEHGDLRMDDIDLATDLFLGGLLQHRLLKNLFGMKTDFSATAMKAAAEKLVDDFIRQHAANAGPGENR